jgi:23S rRNA pseudouridine955/2504/2580 synthase
VEVEVVRGGNPNATTAYSTVRRFDAAGLALLVLEPHEGRTHQLRVQCARHGHPIAGDDRYGDFAANRELAECAGIERMVLVAHRLRFRHPTTGKALAFECDDRPDLAKAFTKLESLKKRVPRR